MEKYPSFSHLAESSVNSQTIHCTTTLQYLVSTSMMFGILTSTYNATHLHITTCNLDKKAEVMLTSVTLKKGQGHWYGTTSLYFTGYNYMPN